MKLTPCIPVFMVMIYILSISPAQAGNSTGNNTGNITSRALDNQSYNIRVVLDHIFISKKNNSFEISEIVVFRNEGPEIYYSRDNHTFFAISTPPGIKNLKTEAMECCLVEEEGAVLMDPMVPIKPGDDFEMQVSYTLLPRGSEFIFNKSTVYNTTALSIFVDKKGGAGIEGSYETVTLHGNKYDVTAFNDMGTGETVRIPIKMTEEPGYLYGGIGLAVLLSVGLVYRFKGKLLGKRRKEPTLEELELEKRRIFQAIRGFEKHAGEEKSEEYRRLMEEYRQKAIRIFIEMDEIKARQTGEDQKG